MGDKPDFEQMAAVALPVHSHLRGGVVNELREAYAAGYKAGIEAGYRAGQERMRYRYSRIWGEQLSIEEPPT